MCASLGLFSWDWLIQLRATYIYIYIFICIYIYTRGCSYVLMWPSESSVITGHDTLRTPLGCQVPSVWVCLPHCPPRGLPFLNTPNVRYPIHENKIDQWKNRNFLLSPPPKYLCVVSIGSHFWSDWLVALYDISLSLYIYIYVLYKDYASMIAIIC